MKTPVLRSVPKRRNGEGKHPALAEGVSHPHLRGQRVQQSHAACLLYQIKRCSGPCVNLISEQAYSEDVRDAGLFLQGRQTEVLESLTIKMRAAADSGNTSKQPCFVIRFRPCAKSARNNWWIAVRRWMPMWLRLSRRMTRVEGYASISP